MATIRGWTVNQILSTTPEDGTAVKMGTERGQVTAVCSYLGSGEAIDLTFAQAPSPSGPWTPIALLAPLHLADTQPSSGVVIRFEFQARWVRGTATGFADGVDPLTVILIEGPIALQAVP
jgi:hypothetical protein